MKVNLTNIGKRYNRHWIFKGLSYEFSSENAYVIMGANGSGKSTLLQLIAGSLSPSEGEISYHNDLVQVPGEQIYSSVGVVAPYLDLIEAYTLEEIIAFHFQFKQFYAGISAKIFIEIIDLPSAQNKPLKEFSSGMKQRVKLALAILSDTPLLLLDEPAANLDKKGVEWYSQLMNKYRNNRLVIVCSNQQKEEYGFCNRELMIENYKG
ncbi:MAG: ABC transporter ATP-binding protein [Bacteroidetes bacterium]|nr:ABC transporter ATP-binding protein [Bacteroidota bacterium]